MLASRHYSLVVVPGLLIAGASLVAERGLWGTRASVVAAPWLYSRGLIDVAHGLSCSKACGVFRDQGWNACLLALADRFFSTEPPGKLSHSFLLKLVLIFNLGFLF